MCGQSRLARPALLEPVNRVNRQNSEITGDTTQCDAILVLFAPQVLAAQCGDLWKRGTNTLEYVRAHADAVS